MKHSSSLSQQGISSTTTPFLKHLTLCLCNCNIPKNTVFWTNSMIALQYNTSSTQRFYTFVEIQLGIFHRASSQQQWRHVPLEDNVDDDATRGLPVQSIQTSERWREALECLKKNGRYENRYPQLPQLHEQIPVDKLLERYSSWYELQCVPAWFMKL
ncbi:uncharacterized protein LOC122248305 [Penaeus japonicus]|uniref:uncharacterized protein LOC122248305 n=1 Tax=Penaeus japonicus TaxID=27405 RepID=UPI001C70F4FE|nr:uncharacterized protein LOC122248305 [Penaeus japonicus]